MLINKQTLNEQQHNVLDKLNKTHSKWFRIAKEKILSSTNHEENIILKQWIKEIENRRNNK